VLVADHKPPHPLHFKLCEACSSRIAHEANAESAFSITNTISDLRQVPLHQRVLVRVKSNRAAYHPDSKTALMRCQQRFEVNFKEIDAAKVGRRSMHTIDRSSTPWHVVYCLKRPTCLVWFSIKKASGQQRSNPSLRRLGVLPSGSGLWRPKTKWKIDTESSCGSSTKI